MPVAGRAEVQKTLNNIISKRAKEQRRLACAPKLVTATTTPASSALLGVLIQQSSPAEASIASSGPRQAPSYAAHSQQSYEQRRARRPEHNGSHTAARGDKGMRSSPACLPASATSEPAELACPLCGVSVKSTALQAHVAAELDELDKAASAALPLGEMNRPVAVAARQHIKTPALQLDRGHVEQQQQPFHGMKGPPHAETARDGAVSTQYSNALRKSSSSAGNCAGVAHHWRHQSAHAAFQDPHLPDQARASSRAALAVSTDESVQGSISSGAALGHDKARNCLQHQRRQAAGMKSAAQHQAGRAQRSQEQAHMSSASGRGSQQQQERRWRPHRRSGVKRNSQIQVFGAALAARPMQPGQQVPAAPAANQRSSSFNHYDNGRGLWDGEMAGLDGLESVGLDCWEGFGTMSMGRI